MGSFNLGKISLQGMFSKPATGMYPVVEAVYAEGCSGKVQMDDIKTCILCGICAKRCPTDCITVDKANETWTIDPFNCITCGTCVRECPKNVLSMAPHYTSPARLKAEVSVKKPEPTPEELEAMRKAEEEKKARIAAAKAAAAAKKAAEEAKAAE